MSLINTNDLKRFTHSLSEGSDYIGGDVLVTEKTFGNVKNQIGYCGIWCGSCLVGNGLLKEISNQYEKMITDYGLKEWAPKDFDFAEFHKGLLSIQTVADCPGCLNSGGQKDCKARNCAIERSLPSCNKCETETCPNREMIDSMRKGAVSAGIKVAVKDAPQEELIDNWISELRLEFPYSMLFARK